MDQDADIYLVQGDLDPPVEATLLDANKQPINLTAAESVTFQAKHQQTHKRITGECAIVEPRVVEGLPVGGVTYEWVEGQTDRPGMYDVTFRIVWSGGLPQTVPNYTAKQLLIRAA